MHAPLRLVVLMLAPAVLPARTVYIVDPPTASVIAYDSATSHAAILSGGPPSAGSGATMKTPLSLGVLPSGHLLVLQGDDGTFFECLDVDPANGHRALLSTVSRTGNLIPGERIYGVLPDGRAVLHGADRGSDSECLLLLDPATGTLQPVSGPEIPPSQWLAAAMSGGRAYSTDAYNRHVDVFGLLTGACSSPFPARIEGIVPAPTVFLPTTYYYYDPSQLNFPFAATSPAVNPAKVQLKVRLMAKAGVRMTASMTTPSSVVPLYQDVYLAGDTFTTQTTPTRTLVSTVHPDPGYPFAGSWNLRLSAKYQNFASPTNAARILDAELRTTDLSTLAASSLHEGILHVVDDHGMVGRLDTVSLVESIVSRGTESSLASPLGRAAAIIPLESGDDLLIEEGTGRTIRVSATDGTRIEVGTIFPTGLHPPDDPISTGASGRFIALAPLPPAPPSSNPSQVLTTLDTSQWEADSLAPTFDPPVFSEEGGLRLVTSNPGNCFGFWQTREPLAAPPAGRYRLTATLVGTPIGEGKRHPEVRVRVFPASNRHSAMRLNAETAPGNGIARPVDILWTSDGVTPWRVAIDLISFAPDIDGGVVVASITNRRLNEGGDQ